MAQASLMGEEEIQFNQVKHRQDWLRQTAEEYIKLESSLPIKDLSSDEKCPSWVEYLEREMGATMFPVAKLKEESKLSVRSLAAIIGHQCALGLWLIDWLQTELKKPQLVDKAKPTPEQIEKTEEFLNKLTNCWYPALRELAKKALSSCMDQPYDDAKEFLSAYAAAFAQKPSGLGTGNMGSSAFNIYNFMLIHWRAIERLNSVHHLHEVLVKVFGPFRTGDLKRIEKICQRIGLHYRKSGRPQKNETIQTAT